MYFNAFEMRHFKRMKLIASNQNSHYSFRGCQSGYDEYDEASIRLQYENVKVFLDKV